MDTTEGAVVIGGSMSGLLAARVLSDHFDHVTVIERDRCPDAAAFRSGVPQARHLHLLLVGGMRIFERLFPGIDGELEDAGAPLVLWGRDTYSLLPNGWLPAFQSSLATRSSSRVLLDWIVRRRLLQNPRITFLEERQVTGLTASDDCRRVTGVRARGGKGSAAQETLLKAALVVDASGRGSSAPEWLQALGYAPPQDTVVNSFLGYATRWYRVPPGLGQDWKMLLIQSRPPELKRGGGLFIVENDTMVVTLAGAARDYPPTDEPGFMEFARSLATPLLYEAIQDAEPLTPIYGYQRTDNRLRHYEKLERLPDGFVVMGDAVCAFNPLYGQGMTVAALAAAALDDCLRTARGDLGGLPLRFQRALKTALAGPWMLATSEDFRYAETEGDRPGLQMRLMHWYTNQIIQLLPEHDDVLQAFTQVMNLLAAPNSLVTPKFVLKVLRQAAGARFRSAPPNAISPVHLADHET